MTEKEELLASPAVKRLVKDVDGWTKLKHIVQSVAAEDCDCADDEYISKGRHHYWCDCENARDIARRMRWKVAADGGG